MNILLLSSIVIVYLFIIGILTFLGYRRTKTAEDYIIAGRSVHPYIMAISYGATFISTSAIVGFGGACSLFGLGIFWLVFLNIFIGIFIAFVYFGKRTRKMGLNLQAHTFPEFLGNRFQSKTLQGLSALVIFIAMPMYAAVVLMGGTHFIANVLSIDYNTALFFFTTIIAIYVLMGGLKGVMYTDAFQGTLMFAGMMLLLIFTYSKLGGFTIAHQKLTDMAPLAQQYFGAKGHTGWTSFPTLGSEFWIVMTTSIILGVGIGVLAQPQLVVRFMTVKSDRELNRAVFLGGVFILIACGGAYIVGALSNVYFMQHPDFANISFFAADKQIDQVMPLYINTAMPSWFTAIFMVTLLSAAMSTLSSQFHAMGTAVGRDIYEKWFGGKGSSMVISKIGILIAILVSLFLAWGMPVFFENGTAIIARGTAIFFGICAAAFLPAFLGSLYFKRMNKTAAMSGFIVGFIASFVYLFFIHTKESAPLGWCNAMFGVDSLAGGTVWAIIDPLVVALPLAIIATIVGQFAGKSLPQEHVVKSFKNIG